MKFPARFSTSGVTVRLAALAIAASFAAPAMAATESDSLPALAADRANVSVSGLSSGAFMAVQYAVAHSADIMGAGVVAGGPYNCAKVAGLNMARCMDTSAIPILGPKLSAGAMLASARDFASRGQVDKLANMHRQHIYIYHGTQDQVVGPAPVDTLYSFYTSAGIPATNISYVNTIPSGHAVITTDFGNSCDANAAPYLSHCAIDGKPYDQPRAILQQIYGPLKDAVVPAADGIITFKQEKYADAYAVMADQGYAYVPSACRANMGCKVHVAIHGCGQSASVVNDDFYGRAGYNGWAESNNIVVIYPQVDKSLANPAGCWDWFGYTGPFYARKNGPQIRAIEKMIQRVTSR